MSAAQLEDPLVLEALRAMDAGSVPSELRPRLESLVADLDKRYWDLSDAADAAEAAGSDSQDIRDAESSAFSQARAASAVLYYINLGSSPDAAQEAGYEAYHAFYDDKEMLREIVRKYLPRLSI